MMRTLSRWPVEPACTDALFVRLLHAWRPWGGLQRAETGASPCPLRFWWHAWWWTPALGLQPSCPAELQQIVGELRPALDDLDILCWFVEPSPWLGGERPLALLHAQPLRVLACARVDRFVAAG